MENQVDMSLDPQAFGDISTQQVERHTGQEMRHVLRYAREEIAQAQHLITRVQQALTEVRSEKSCATCDDCPFHGSPRSPSALPLLLGQLRSSSSSSGRRLS